MEIEQGQCLARSCERPVFPKNLETLDGRAGINSPRLRRIQPSHRSQAVERGRWLTPETPPAAV